MMVDMGNGTVTKVTDSLTSTGTAGTERTRRVSGVPAVPVERTKTQVIPSSKRRRLTAQYKLKVISTVSQLRQENAGEIGAYLRGQGLYYSNVSTWEKQLENGQLGVKRGPNKSVSKSDSKEKNYLKRKIELLEKKLERANALIELQKKISDLMGLQQISLNE